MGIRNQRFEYLFHGIHRAVCLFLQTKCTIVMRQQLRWILIPCRGMCNFDALKDVKVHEVPHHLNYMMGLSMQPEGSPPSIQQVVAAEHFELPTCSGSILYYIWVAWIVSILFWCARLNANIQLYWPSEIKTSKDPLGGSRHIKGSKTQIASTRRVGTSVYILVFNINDCQTDFPQLSTRFLCE